ncbi:MAG: squalene--hopene cyclase [Planctomycetaceae bacterium]|nr:squalene--hopene cyclase [Planctomycetaceae bacterium]
MMTIDRWPLLAGLFVLFIPAAAIGQGINPKGVQTILAEEGDKFPGGLVPGHVPAKPDEPLAEEFSLEKAARSMDLAALNWQMQPRQQCSQCHANMMHLVARPALARVLPEPPDVRQLFEQHIVARRWEKHGLIYTFEAVAVAVPLALHDRQTTGKLHPVTRKALDRMLEAQQPDGSWDDIAGGKYAFMLRFEQTMFAAVGIGQAPDGYSETEPARNALERIRKFTQLNPPKTAYSKGMLLWASVHVDGLVTAENRATFADEILSLQRPDGGWALRQMLADDPAQPAGRFASVLPSDGYGTGFALFALRQAGVAANDPRVRSGVTWLKSHQRASGRWFHPTLSNRPNNVLSNTATAWAVLALQACGEIPAQQ